MVGAAAPVNEFNATQLLRRKLYDLCFNIKKNTLLRHKSLQPLRMVYFPNTTSLPLLHLEGPLAGFPMGKLKPSDSSQFTIRPRSSPKLAPLTVGLSPALRAATQAEAPVPSLGKRSAVTTSSDP